MRLIAIASDPTSLVSDGGPVLGLVVEGGSDDVGILLSVFFSGPPDCLACHTAIANDVSSLMRSGRLESGLVLEREPDVLVVFIV